MENVTWGMLGHQRYGPKTGIPNILSEVGNNHLYGTLNIVCELQIQNKRLSQHCRHWRSRVELLSDSEFFDQLAIACEVMLLQVVEEAFSFTYKLHKATVGREIFFVLLKVPTDLCDTLSQLSDLTFNGTGVGSFTTKLGKNGFVFFCS